MTFLSLTHDGVTGDAIVKLKDQEGRVVALRLRPRELETLARGVAGLRDASE